MTKPVFSILLATCLWLSAEAQTPAAAQPPVSASAETNPLEELLHHSLQVQLDPMNETIEVQDQLRLPNAWRGQQLQFELNAALTITRANLSIREVTNAAANAGEVIASTVAQEASTRGYEIDVPANFRGDFQLTYNGKINDLAEQDSAEYAQSFAETSGIISSEGVFLSRASVWVPLFDDGLITFDLDTRFAATAGTWSAVSQGDADGPTSWRSEQPMEEIYLIAADFTIYRQAAGDVEALAYLRTPDTNLATKYLDATARYLQLYEPLLGGYAFSKFALVENFWETGFGMPSFTLLGEQVIRFPFILESSYPHEILHNWWGNGVFPDYESGNWSEGLTAYLADHLFREMDGVGHEYRKEMLARYKNYVADGDDFPLSQFTSRNSAATQAVGYGKTLMLWHMLRIELGDELFIAGLQHFYDQFKFKRASFSDIEGLFSELSGKDLAPFFSQWVDRIGAPELSIRVEEVNGNRARILFAQTQFEDPYQLKVPVALFYEGESEPQIYDIALTQKLEGVMAEDFDKLQAVLVDPFFDVFRTLDREETPPTVGELFGASGITFIMPLEDREQWTRLAENYGQGIDFELVFADSIEELPTDRSVWVLGQSNPFAAAVVDSAANYGVSKGPSGITIDGSEVAYSNRSSVIVGRHPANPELALGWIHVDDMVAMSGMIEKLPHYGKYSYLSFVGSEPTNDIKGVWASPDSPLQWIKPALTGAIAWDGLAPAPAIAELPPKYLPEQLARHTNALTSAEMEGRGLGSVGLDQAARYIADQFRAAGLQPIDGIYFQRWRDELEGKGLVRLGNVVGMIPGVNTDLSGEPIVLGAHYDHLGIDADTGVVYAGADDNASGISVLIEVARKLARAFTPQRPILFVAFTGEEAGLMGSAHFVNNPPGGFETENLFAMVNMDSVGRLEGQTLQVFSTESAYEWPFMAQGIGFTIGVPSEFPAQTIASSDHVSFLNAGIPAIHLFSGTHLDYHQPSDTTDKLDLRGMSNVALWVEEAIVYLADRIDPLRVNLENAQVEVSAAATSREASLGTIPDFAYDGEGVRISGVTPGGAAEAAGLQGMDIILQFNGATVDSLQNYSNMLRAAAPGEQIAVTVRRGEEIFTVDAELKAR